MGKPSYRVSADEAMNHVFGFVAANDVSARDISMGESATHPLFLQIARGKGAPSFCPLGPWVATSDEFPDPAAIRLRLWVNDISRQDDRVSSMVVGIPALVASVTSSIALYPGDLILTGTPGGCAFQLPGAPFLVPGDIVRGQIEGLGELANTITDEEKV
jgi:2-keto-4-pentenoate hydratase/2-oxohepta-3-ene-1,7-dioic acid hydratase in catechol pathway